ncbi:hypothetical protein [Gemmatimonas sp.]|uniref:hypothetical protein n=1 Tax=Gemmatimonas sp. TaxID=1962908 RepID=UPI00391EE720
MATSGARRALVAGLTVAGLLGCGGTETGTMTADLERDLDLAVRARRPQTVVVSALEGGPRGAPSGAERGQRDVVATPRRAPRAAPQALPEEVPTVAEPENSTAPVGADEAATVDAPAPEPQVAPDAPAPEPAPMPVTRGPSAGHDGEASVEEGQGRGRRGSGLGTLIGVIIRGGAAGIDNCEEHDRRRAGRRRGGTNGGMGGYGGDIIMAGGGVLGGVMGGVIANGGGIRRPTFPR